jgi:NADH:ubiquinone reductase (H+-translocating)
MFLKREVVALGALETPREEFYEAAKPAPVAAPSKAEEKPKAEQAKAS